jgi:hypothetical protein
VTDIKTALKTMTLVEIGEAIRTTGTLRPTLAFDELARRQRQLDAAEGMANVCRGLKISGDTSWDADIAREALAAYQAAKGDR